MENFDVVIIGGGVAGMSTAIYAKRRGKNVAIIEKFALGGQVNALLKIENFPSQTEVDGLTLGQMFAKQVKGLNVKIINDDVLSVDLLAEPKVVCGKKDRYQAKSVVIATGLTSVPIGVNEDDFIGRGVSYCVVCDAPLYKNKSVCVASKNGTGLKGAVELAEICKDVTVLDEGDMSVFAKANKNKKINVISNANITKVVGDDVVKGLEYNIVGEEHKIDTDALFIELGKKPLNLFEGLQVDKNGFIVTDEKMQTSIPNVFAVGDVRSKDLRQIVTACSDGAIAGQFA